MGDVPADPGIYVEELPVVPRTIEAVPTSVTLFLGYALRGPLDRGVTVRSWAGYVRAFGSVTGGAAAGVHDLRAAHAARPDVVPDVDYLGHAVRGFFDNGGSVAVVRRIATGDAGTPLARASAAIQAPVPLRFTAVDEGTWANGLVCEVAAPGGPGGWAVAIGRPDAAGGMVVVERFEGRESGPSLGEAIQAAVNDRSALVRVAPEGGPAAGAGPRATLAGGGDGVPDGDPAAYLAGLDGSDPDTVEAALVAIPGAAWDAGGRPIVEAVLAHAEARGRWLVLVDPPRDTPLADPAAVAALGLPATSHGALYVPWLVVPDPVRDPSLPPDATATVIVPPSGVVAGVITRTDRERGVWTAPAGSGARLAGVEGLQPNAGGGRRGQVAQDGVNEIRRVPGGGAVVWGARTLASTADPEWRYVSVRRLALMIEASLDRGTRWAVFEPNDERLWAALRGAAGTFLHGLYRAGALQGTVPSQAYLVRCGAGSTMTQADIDRGRVILEVAFAPLRPAEFVVIRIEQQAARPGVRDC